MYAPARGPRVGPRNGPKMNNNAGPLPTFSRAQRSATVPPPMASPAEPRNAARNLHARRLAKVVDAPAPAVKARKQVQVPIYTHLRPRVSESGAMKSGPIAMPRVYRVKGRVASVRETLNASWRSGMAGTVTDVAKVLSLLDKSL